MNNIVSYPQYCQRMANSLLEKVFFTEHLALDCLVDYGCADGTLLRYLSENSDILVLEGYDSDPAMVKAAQKQNEVDLVKGNAPYLVPNFFSREEEFFDSVHANTHFGHNGVLFSSVLHEMYTYQPETMEVFWKKLADTGVQHIIIRDMYWGSQSPQNFPSAQDFAGALSSSILKQQVASFELSGRAMMNPQHFTEFLLKQPYYQNWKRELEENYLSIPSTLPTTLNGLGYAPLYFRRYTPSFIDERLQKDLGITLPVTTHVQAIFSKHAH